MGRIRNNEISDLILLALPRTYQYKDDEVKELQKEVDETADLMRENIINIVERGEKLEDLDERTGQYCHLFMKCI